MYSLKFKYKKNALIKHKILFSANTIVLKSIFHKDKVFHTNDITDIKYTFASATSRSGNDYKKILAVTFNDGLLIYICENPCVDKKKPEIEFFKKNFSHRFSNTEVDRLSTLNSKYE